MESLLNLLEPLLVLYSGKLGFLPALISWVGTARLFLKPLVSIARTYVDISPSKSDNLALDKLLSSKPYKAFQYFVDWFSSVKLPKKESK